MAEQQSEAVLVARAGVTRAEGTVLQARSQRLPQLTGTASYTRTLASQFSDRAGAAPPPPDARIPRPVAGAGADTLARCANYLPPVGTAATAEQLASYAACASAFGSSGGIDFSQAGFGAANQYNFGLAGSLPLYSGGRITAQNNAALAGRRSAEAELRAQRAQLTLDVTQSYFDAALADRLLVVADSSLAQTEEVLRQTRVAKNVGNQSEFELLRAQVTRDNQVPVVLQRRTDRDLAFLRLKQLLDLPLADSLSLTTTLPDSAPAATTAEPLSLPARTAFLDTLPVDERAPVMQAAEAVRTQQALLRVARAEYLPALSLSSSYGRVAFPTNTFPGSFADFRTNWTVTVGASVPLFTGGRLRGDNLIARANLDEAKARLQQTREYAAVDSRLAQFQLDQAQVAFSASAGTAQQAARAYAIAQVRFHEGISTQTELSDSRLLLEQASANRALAARNLEVARVRLRLLRDLPLQAASASQGISQGVAPGATAQQQNTAAQRGASSSFTQTTGGATTGQPQTGTTQGTTGSVTP
jgi:outer membrane protein TolC